MQTVRLQQITSELAELAARQQDRWPDESLRLLRDAGWPRWCIDPVHGGSRLPAAEMTAWYEALGAGDLAVALIATQHDAAVDLIGQSDNDDLKHRLLPRFASGELLATVGISQLTTSRQGGQPAMRVTPDGSAAFTLAGVMPWVTSAAKCSHIVTGGVLPDGSQLLACIEPDRTGVRIDPPLDLLALQSSHTSRVHCENVPITPADIIRGPVPQALARRSPIKPLTVSSVGIGVAGSLLRLVESAVNHSEYAGPPGRPFRDLVASLQDRHAAVRDSVFAAGRRIDRGDTPEAAQIRIAVNDLAARLALAAMTFGKGTAYVRGHPVERLVRHALFLLVWSAPADVRLGTLTAIIGT